MLHLPPPSLPLAWTLYAVLVVGCLVGAAGRAPRLAGWVVAAAFTWWVAIGFSYGKVDHDHLALVVALWVLPTVGAVPGRWRSTRSSAQAGWALKCVQIAVVATYFLSALVKIRNGGWSLAALARELHPALGDRPAAARAGAVPDAVPRACCR